MMMKKKIKRTMRVIEVIMVMTITASVTILLHDLPENAESCFVNDK